MSYAQFSPKERCTAFEAGGTAAECAECAAVVDNAPVLVALVAGAQAGPP